MRLEQVQQHIPPGVEHAVNWAALGTTVGAILGYLPGVAALFSIIWLGLQIWVFLFIKKPWKKGSK